MRLWAIRGRGEDDTGSHSCRDDEYEQENTIADQCNLFPFKLDGFTSFLFLQPRFILLNGRRNTKQKLAQTLIVGTHAVARRRRHGCSNRCNSFIYSFIQKIYSNSSLSAKIPIAKLINSIHFFSPSISYYIHDSVSNTLIFVRFD